MLPTVLSFVLIASASIARPLHAGKAPKLPPCFQKLTQEDAAAFAAMQIPADFYTKQKQEREKAKVFIETLRSSEAPKKTNFNQLPSVAHLPLSENTKQTIREHPIYDYLEKHRNENKGIHLIRNPHSSPNADQPIEHTNFGEDIQIQFLQQVLDYAAEADEKSDRTLLPVQVVDTGEIAHTYTEFSALGSERRPDFKMQDLKTSNPSGEVIPKTQLRSALGIPSDRPVVSLYGSAGLTAGGLTRQNEVKGALDKITANGGIIFLSYGGKDVEPSTIATLQKTMPDYTVIPLSKAGTLTYKTFKKLIIVNDLIGKLPYVHAVSDMSIINGPINPYESLSVQTPTVIMANENIQGNYSTADFNQSLNRAQRSGGVQLATTQQDIIQAYATREQRREIQAPHTLRANSDGRNYLQVTLDRLLDFIKKNG